MTPFLRGDVAPLPFEVQLDQRRIAARVAELGREITRDYEDKAPVLIGVLKGCIVFLGDLMRQINLPLEVEFVRAASYHRGVSPSETVELSSEITVDLQGRDVLIVEGIVDTGNTVRTIMEQLRQSEPASIEVVTLLDKPASHRSTLKIKYRGFAIGNEFVIGYGLDNTQRYRNLPFIGRVIDT